VSDTRGRRQADDLAAAVRAVGRAPLPGARDLYVLRKLLRSGGFADAQENVLVEVADHLAATRRRFALRDNVVFQRRGARGGDRLIPLTEGSSVVVGAEDHLGNLMVCEAADGQFPVPRGLVELLLRSELLTRALPEIKTYAKRPVFDDDLV